MKYIDLNCDIAKSFGHYKLGDDAAMLKLATSVNIACGVHAGDPLIIQRAVALSANEEVVIGASLGFPDRQGLGQRTMALSPDELQAYIIYQIGALEAFTKRFNTQLSYIRPYGALYDLAIGNADVAQAITDALNLYNPNLIVVTQPGAALALAARGFGLRVAYEGFANRAYNDDGNLVPADQPGAVIHDPKQVIQRAVRMAIHGEVETIHGKAIPFQIDTLHINGDTLSEIQTATELCAALEAAGIFITPLLNVLAQRTL